MLARPMRAYTPFAQWLHASYCFDVRIGAFDVYRRKAVHGDCPYPWFPQPFGAVDWNGAALSVPIPKVADEDLTRQLPRGDYYRPIWFKDAPRPPGLGVLRDSRREKEEADAEREGFRIERVDGESP